MENLDLPKTPSEAPKPGASASQDQFDALRQLVISMLILVIVLSGTFNIFMYRQVKYSRADLAAVRPQATQLVGDYERISMPAMREFASRLVEFARAHPTDDAFAAILKKYHLFDFASGTNAPAPKAAAPAPAALPPTQGQKK